MFNYEKEYPADWRNLVLSRVHGAKPFTMQRVVTRSIQLFINLETVKQMCTISKPIRAFKSNLINDDRWQIVTSPLSSIIF